MLPRLIPSQAYSGKSTLFNSGCQNMSCALLCIPPLNHFYLPCLMTPFRMVSLLSKAICKSSTKIVSSEIVKSTGKINSIERYSQIIFPLLGISPMIMRQNRERRGDLIRVSSPPPADCDERFAGSRRNRCAVAAPVAATAF